MACTTSYLHYRIQCAKGEGSCSWVTCVQKVGSAAKGIASKLGEESLAEWINVDKETPVYHTDSKVMNIVLNPNKNNGSDEDKTEVAERLTMDKLFELTDKLITRLKQHTFVTEQELITLHLFYEK